jgi:hypothetical protein
MRRSSHNTARRLLLTGTAAVSFTALAVALTLSEAGAATRTSGRELAPAVADAPSGVVVAVDRDASAGSSSLIAAAVSSVVRTGATAATATVTGGAAATGASAAALPDTSSPGTVLAISGVFLTLCAAAAWGLLRTRGREHHTS